MNIKYRIISTQNISGVREKFFVQRYSSSKGWLTIKSCDWYWEAIDFMQTKFPCNHPSIKIIKEYEISGEAFFNET
jgi:hypothetical protein